MPTITEITGLAAELTAIEARLTKLETPVSTQSPSGTIIPPATKIIDTVNATWTVEGGVVYRKNVKDTSTMNVALLLYWKSSVYQSNTAGGWWKWTGSVWSATTDPRLAA